MLDIQHNQTNSPLTEQERRQMLVEWNATERTYPYEQCLQQLFEAQVARTPHAPAVLFENLRLSYQDLNVYTNQLAHHLRRLGVGPDVLVGVYMERSLEMLIALLGILKAGGAYVPLDPTYPPERVAFMLADMAHGHAQKDDTTQVLRTIKKESTQSNASLASRTSVQPEQQILVLTQPHLMGQLSANTAHVICLAIEDEDDDVGPLRIIDDRNAKTSGRAFMTFKQETTNPPCVTKAHNLAYVIYTSGSTGQPKGAMNTQRGICNRLLWMQDAYQLTATDAVLQKTPFSFDVSVWEFFWPLLTGARLVIARPAGHMDSAYLISLIQQQQITTLHFVPSMLQIFLEEPGLESCSSLQRVICSGEALSYALQERFFARHAAALYNLYGPTEAAIDVTHWTCQRNSKRHSVPIGYPIANTQIYILAGNGQPVPVGEQGELYIGGVGVARGYLNRAKLTAERFVHDPFSSHPNARLYRTGDIARYLPDGAIEYLGRVDQQVKLHGFRIELAEIEAVLAYYPAVRKAIVTVREDTPGTKHLVAYLVLHTQFHANIADIQRYLQNQLPPFMIPSAWVVLVAFPLTSSGKVDRQALPVPDYAHPALKQPFSAPRTEIEKIIADTWTQVLGVQQIGIDDNFFALGGHSLLAMHATMLLRSSLQVEIPLRSFFAAPTVAQFAAQVGQLKSAGAAPPLPPLRALPRAVSTHTSLPKDAVVLPASFAQQRFWFMDQLDPHNPAYTIPATLHFHGHLNKHALQQSLTVMAQRHEVLRTSFAQIDGELMQVIVQLDPTGVDVGVIHANSTLEEEAAQAFDLAQGPLWRVMLSQPEPEQYELFLLIHHSIADGWSIGLFFQELTMLYTAFTTNQPATLPALPVQYADFALWQREYLHKERLAAHLHYWQQQLAGAPDVLELPTDHPRPLHPTHNGSTHTFTLSSQLTASLRVLSRQEGVTLYMTLLAAFQTLLHRYTGQDDLVVGSAVAQREQPEVQHLLGLFLNAVALRVNLAGNPTVHELLGRVREVVLDAHAHQDLPFERLIQELNLHRSRRQNPLFQVSFQLDPPAPASSTQWTLTRMSTGTKATRFDLSLELEDLPDGLSGHIEYSTDLFDATTIARMADHWETLLQAMVADPAQHLATLPLLTHAERQQILFDWNTTQVAYPKTATLTQLFEAQVERTPQAPAIMFNDTSLSYERLNRDANQFAHYLQKCGIQPGARVALCYERSHELIVALLGILKAGGTYVPLDPAYPAERLTFMLTDSQATALVTQQHLLDILPQTTISNIICMDRTWQTIQLENPRNPDRLVGGEDPAYMLYTSGSTGNPKGVLGTHRAALNRFNWMWRTYPFEPDEVCCQKTTLSFVDSVWEIFGPLLQGIPTVIIPDMIVKDPQLFLQVLGVHKVTRIVLVPSLLRALLDSENSLNAAIPTLQYWICSGETLSSELVQSFQQRLPGCILLNLYGSSEVAADATYYEVKDAANLSAIPIGRPIDNTQIYLLDRSMQPVPVGVPGELYVGGDGLALGYFNRPDLTAAKFVHHSFGEQREVLLYKTGDWARYQPDGTIDYLGRLDHQVKIRGIRIELGEIESVLSQHPMVHEAVVVAREDVPGDQRLVAYFVLHTGNAASQDDIRHYLAAHLPAYMVPSVYVNLAALPLTPNGKVDRRALPAPTSVRETASATYVAPYLTVHHQLVQIWEDLLNTCPIGIRDDFFALGGHSFLAVRLMARIQQTWGQKLPLSTLFAGATIEHLAQVLQEENQASTTRTPITPIRTSGTKRPFFFLHGDWQGKALYGLKLAEALGEDQPFYLLETYKYNDMAVLPTLKEVAAAHIAAIRAIQPEGPYTLGGWCNGALFAYEMAQQLQAAGQRVDMLVLMDPGTSTIASTFIRKGIQRLNRLKPLQEGQQLDYFLRLLHLYEYVRLWNYHRKLAAIQSRTELEGTEAEVEAAHPNFQMLLPTRADLHQNYISIFNWWASAYKIEPYTGKIGVFWAKEDDAKQRKEWERLLIGKQDVSIYMVPGNHVTSRTKYAESLAASLRDCLHNAAT